MSSYHKITLFAWLNHSLRKVNVSGAIRPLDPFHSGNVSRVPQQVELVFILQAYDLILCCDDTKCFATPITNDPISICSFIGCKTSLTRILALPFLWLIRISLFKSHGIWNDNHYVDNIAPTKVEFGCIPTSLCLSAWAWQIKFPPRILPGTLPERTRCPCFPKFPFKKAMYLCFTFRAVLGPLWRLCTHFAPRGRHVSGGSFQSQPPQQHLSPQQQFSTSPCSSR